jgi:cell division topological specificity factor MinE
MSFLELFRRRGSAPVARERLQILLSYERASHGQSDLLAILREEILSAITKHVTVERDSETALLWAPVGSALANDGSAVTAPVLSDELKVGSTVTFEGEWTPVLAPAKAVRPTAWSTCVAEDEVMVAFISY